MSQSLESFTNLFCRTRPINVGAIRSVGRNHFLVNIISSNRTDVAGCIYRIAREPTTIKLAPLRLENRMTATLKTMNEIIPPATMPIPLQITVVVGFVLGMIAPISPYGARSSSMSP
jgi:hypothetical protein